MRRFLSALGVFATFLNATEVRAEASVYEGFSDYATAAEVLASEGGSGFVGSWQPGNSLVGGAGVPAANSVELRPDSLSFTDVDGNQLATTGGSLFLTGQFGSVKVARTYNQASLPHPAPPQVGQSTFVSFLARRSGPAADPSDPVYNNAYPWGDNLYPRVAGVTMYSNDGGDQVPLLIGNLSNVDQDVWRLAGQDLDDQVPPPATDAPFGEGANTYFIVMRLDHAAGDGGGDTIHLYLNPHLGSEGMNTASLIENWEADDDPLYLPGDWLAIEAGDASSNRPYAEFSFDEYRIGSSWADVAPIAVVPEPAAGVVLGFTLLSLGLGRGPRATARRC